MNKNSIRDGIVGVAIGDMLGVPVEFSSREERGSDPVVGLRSHGTYDQPLGAWSDDTSLTLALADALSNGYSLQIIAQNFLDWWIKKKYTSHGIVFDIGTQTRLALNVVLKIMEAEDYESLEYLHYDAHEETNGNGSLMRILPLYFYLNSLEGKIEEHFNTVWQVSALTHPHIRSALACMIYLVLIDELVQKPTIDEAFTSMKSRIEAFMEKAEIYQDERQSFRRVLTRNLADIPREDIRSSGYVLDTLEASIWCLLTTESYEEAVLKAVNLGEDTDTVGAITGGLAGIFYGTESIPEAWLKSVAKIKEIEGICSKLTQYYK